MVDPFLQEFKEPEMLVSLLLLGLLRVFYVCEFVFPTEPDIMKVHKVALFLTRFHNIDQACLPTYTTHFPVAPFTFIGSVFLI